MSHSTTRLLRYIALIGLSLLFATLTPGLSRGQSADTGSRETSSDRRSESPLSKRLEALKPQSLSADLIGGPATGPKATSSVGTSTSTRTSGRPAYPILFVHGLVASDETWATVLDALRRERGWGPPFGDPDQTFFAALNADASSTRLEDDVVTQFSNCCNNFSDGSLFTVSFAVDYNATTGEASFDTENTDGRTDSYEAGIVKQGAALSEAIREVLAATSAEKVILVGHSMGGLAIREYLQRRTSTGTPRWWVAPGEQEGHRVARVVTYGTPHRGSNFGTLPLMQGPASPKLGSQEGAGKRQSKRDSPKIVIGGNDTQAEAVRDLRYNYTFGTQGRYLYGGLEGWGSSFYNEDVNADGDESDFITGINVTGADAPSDGTYANPDLPLPTSIPYTWITADNGGLGTGDGIVRRERQWLYVTFEGTKFPDPFTADTLLTGADHDNQTEDVQGLIRGLDEPDFLSEAYTIPTNASARAYIDGYFTSQWSRSERPLVDADAYTYVPAGEVVGSTPGTTTIRLPSVPSAGEWSLVAFENGLPTAFLRDDAAASEPVSVSVSTTSGYEQHVAVQGEVTSASDRRPYSIRTDTQPLQHFDYTARHREYGNSDQIGYASLVVPPGVATINGQPLDVGDEIGVFTPEGLCVGAVSWHGTGAFISAFGTDAGGLSPGDSLRVRLWDQSSELEYFTEGTLQQSGGRYDPGAVIVATEITASSVLPVELAEFEGTARGDAIQLAWTTLSERANAGFGVQRALGGRGTPWTRVGFVEGAGTTAQPTRYRFTDDAVPFEADTLRYRLRQVDADGTQTLSAPVVVARSAGAQARLVNAFPNPARRQITVQYALPRGEDTAALLLYDALGRRLRERSLIAGKGRREAQVSVAGLAPGLYFLRLQAGQTVETLRVTVVD